MPEKSTPANRSGSRKKTEGFTSAERAAMKERAKELKAAKEGKDGEADLLAKIRAMKEPDRTMARRVHEVVRAAAPTLVPKTWYGMPAYAKDGKVVCFFQNAGKFGARYSTFGFSDVAKLDAGAMWPTSFALHGFTAAEEKKLAALVKKAIR